jgi:hypothetical protein
MKQNQIQFVVAIQTAQLVLLALVLLAGMLLAGCKPEAPVAAGGDIAGVYTLVSVDGNKVPCKVTHEGTSLQVQSGSFTIKADGTCGTKTAFVPPSGSEVTREVSATYTKDGSKLTMKWQGAGTTTATLEGGTLTMNNEGMLFVYTK